MPTAERPAHVVIFAKAPVPGRVKTRLIPAVGAKGAADIAVELLDSVQRTVEESGLAAELCADPALSSQDWALQRVSATFERSEQGEGDLGQRMERAVLRVLDRGRNPILVGTDCPGLGADSLILAGQSLRDHDCVIYPAADGGYVLLGLRKSHASLFSGIDWGRGSVFSQTMKAIGELGWSVYTGPTYNDIDRPADLAGWNRGR